MAYTIRSMHEADIAAVQQIAKVSWNDTYQKIIPEPVQEAFLLQAYSEEMLKRRMTHSRMLVAEGEGMLAGFINTSLPNEKKEAELFAIYLLPSQQRKGIGEALLQEAIRYLPDAEKLYVNVESDNRKGHSFYVKQGFRVMDVFDDDFDGHMLKTTRMLLPLPVTGKA